MTDVEETKQNLINSIKDDIEEAKATHGSFSPIWHKMDRIEGKYDLDAHGFSADPTDYGYESAEEAEQDDKDIADGLEAVWEFDPKLSKAQARKIAKQHYQYLTNHYDDGEILNKINKNDPSKATFRPLNYHDMQKPFNDFKSAIKETNFGKENQKHANAKKVINYLDNMKDKVNDKNAPKILDEVTANLYDDYADKVDDAIDAMNLIFVDDMNDNPDDFIDDGYTQKDIDKANQAQGDYVTPDTLEDVDTKMVIDVINRLE